MGRHSATPSSGRHTSTGPGGRLLAAVLAVAVAVLLVGGAIWVLGDRGNSKDATGGGNATGGSGSEGCEQQPVRVATTAEMAPVINDLTKGTIRDDGCTSYVVTVNTPTEVTDSIRTQDKQRPAVWIPDSTVWTKDPGLADVTVGPTVATSPSMIAVPASLASPATTGAQPWKSITTSMPFLMDRPEASSPTTLAVTAASRTLGTDQRAKEALTSTILEMSHADTSGGALFDQASAVKTKARAFPSSEQAIAAYNRDNPQSKLSALVPKEGTAMLRYPFVRIKDAPGSTPEAVDSLQKLLTSDDAKVSLRNNGFRIAESESGPSLPGEPNPMPQTIADPSDAEVTQLLDLWGKAALDSRQLVVIDVSGSMQGRTKGGDTRIQLARDAGKIGLATIPRTTEMGLWTFSTLLAGQKDYKEQVPIRRLDTKVGSSDQFATLTKAMNDLPGQTRGDTGLFDTTLAAYQAAVTSYNPNRVNSVVIITDGANDDPAGGISQEALIASLKRIKNPDRPVSIMMIGLGTEPKQSELQPIVSAVGGEVFQAQNPEDVKQIFLKAIQSRQASS
ncbi:substrate-binding domain-containing protein [Luteipulveratus mongoliensis]|uniref:VWFA domain-containing protein n=1 Tax=Luteipulveratus mongoliensis TaxID=571913 RepID=A0A0K1JF64_9MICO|nr:substrate-binding domain-containing protein [Luteipulveratus mongoliensis]AKU15367.1 hypothetical protein VV02_04950 [Luteipulveratus mongoliensis]